MHLLCWDVLPAYRPYMRRTDRRRPGLRIPASRCIAKKVSGGHRAQGIRRCGVGPVRVVGEARFSWKGGATGTFRLHPAGDHRALLPFSVDGNVVIDLYQIAVSDTAAVLSRMGPPRQPTQRRRNKKTQVLHLRMIRRVRKLRAPTPPTSPYALTITTGALAEARWSTRIRRRCWM